MIHTQKYLIDNNVPIDGEAFEKAKNYFARYGVKWSYDREPNNRRVIMSAHPSAKNNINNAYLQECNGIIFDARTWKILMYPPGTLCYRPNMKKCNKFLYQGLYHVYHAEDGTNINLYYCNDRWYISTTNGLEMNHVKWGSSTYEEVLNDILKNYGYDYSSLCSKLDKYICYSFGIKHPDLHHFWENTGKAIKKIWFIQAVNLDPESKSYLWTDGKYAPEGIPLQKIYSEAIPNMQSLHDIAEKAYDNYIKYIERHDDVTSVTTGLTSVTTGLTSVTTGREEKKETLDTFDNLLLDISANVPPVCYGFILRSVNPIETGFYSNLFIESSIMRHIRQIWYDREINALSQHYNYNRTESILLLSYLTDKFYAYFTILFPQYEEQFRIFSEKISTLVEQMICNDNRDENIIDLVDRFKLYASNRMLLNVSEDQKRTPYYKKILYEFIVHPANFHILRGYVYKY